MINWLSRNRKWVFSGIGVFFIGVLFNIYIASNEKPMGTGTTSAVDNSKGAVVIQGNSGKIDIVQTESAKQQPDKKVNTNGRSQLEVNSFELGYSNLMICAEPNNQLWKLRAQSIIDSLGINVSDAKLSCNGLPEIIQNKVLPLLASKDLEAAKWLMISNNFIVAISESTRGHREFSDLKESLKYLTISTEIKEQVSESIVLASQANTGNLDSSNHLLEALNLLRSEITGGL